MSTPPKSSGSSSPQISDTSDSSLITVRISPDVALTLTVTNVVCSFATKCHLNLRKIALQGMHVEFKKENNMVSMKLRKPGTTASMWSSGKCTCTGAQSESDAYKAARRYCRLLQKMNFRVKLTNYRVVNVLATCILPFQLDVVRLAEQYPDECSYEPELHPGATFKVNEHRATLKLFSTGSVTLTAPSVSAAAKAIQCTYPLLERFKFDNSPKPAPAQEPPNVLTTIVRLTPEPPTPTPAAPDHFGSTYHHHHHIHHHHQSTLIQYETWGHHYHNLGDGQLASTSHVPLPSTMGAQPPQTSSHHWFSDNLLIDNVLDDFLQ